MPSLLRRGLTCLILTVSLTLVGCTAASHTERKGQTGGDVESAEAITDGDGLLFFIMPGVVAYAIDFSSGTLYLPSGHTQAQVATLRLEDGMDVAALERLLSEKSGKPVDLDSEALKVAEVESLDEALALVRMAGIDNADRLARDALPGGDVL